MFMKGGGHLGGKRKNGASVLVSLETVVRYTGLPDMRMNVFVPGKLSRQGEDWLLEYTDTETDENTGSVTEMDVALRIGKKRVELEQKGAFANTMIFEKGLTFEGSYRTPYGDMPLSVFPLKVSSDCSASDGAVYLRYQLNSQCGLISTNELQLKYQADGNASKPRAGSGKPA